MIDWYSGSAAAAAEGSGFWKDIDDNMVTFLIEDDLSFTLKKLALDFRIDEWMLCKIR